MKKSEFLANLINDHMLVYRNRGAECSIFNDCETCRYNFVCKDYFGRKCPKFTDEEISNAKELYPEYFI